MSGLIMFNNHHTNLALIQVDCAASITCGLRSDVHQVWALRTILVTTNSYSTKLYRRRSLSKGRDNRRYISLSPSRSTTLQLLHWIAPTAPKNSPMGHLCHPKSASCPTGVILEPACWLPSIKDWRLSCPNRCIVPLHESDASRLCGHAVK